MKWYQNAANEMMKNRKGTPCRDRKENEKIQGLNRAQRKKRGSL